MSNTDKIQDHSKAQHNILFILWIMAALANIKSIFADYDVDLSYAVAMSYRHLNGDRLFAEMLEPHQTSSFITDVLMLIFKTITGGYEGVVIYLNICGVVLYAILSLFLVKTLVKYAGKIASNLAGILVFSFRVRQVVMPEFTNMMIGFSILLIIFLIKYFEDEQKTTYLLAAAVSLCLTVLSYPSTIVIFLVVIILLIRYSDNTVRDIVIFSSVCIVLGIIYVTRLFLAVGFDSLVYNLNLMISGDSWHSADRTPEFYTYFRDTLIGIIWIIGSAITSIILCIPIIFRNRKINKTFFETVFSIVLIISDILCTAFLQKYTLRYIYGTVLILLTILGGKYIKHCTKTNQRIWFISLIVSVGDCVAVALLTNMELITIIQYMIPVAAISLILFFQGMENTLEKEKVYVIPFMLVLAVIIHRGLIIRPYSGPGTSILDIENIVRTGPAKGVVCDYMSAYMNTCNNEDWSLYVNDSDTLLVVDSELCDSLLYLMKSSHVGHYSVIDTPTYNESLEKYWFKNPEKEPTVIAVECWYGEMHIANDAWIMNRIDQDYECIGEGRFYRFYKKVGQE